MKYYDFIAFLGVFIIVATTLYIDTVIGAYVTGVACIVIAFVLASTNTRHRKGGDR